MFNFLCKLFAKQKQQQGKFQVGEEVKLSCCSLVFSDCDCRHNKTGTVKSVSVEPAQFWYTVEMQDGTHRTVHESDLEKINKDG